MDQAMEWARASDHHDKQRLIRFCGLRRSLFVTLKCWHKHWQFYDDEVSKLLPHPAELAGLIEPYFPLGQYIALSFRHLIDDMIEIHPTTWGVIVVLELIH